MRLPCTTLSQADVVALSDRGIDIADRYGAVAPLFVSDFSSGVGTAVAGQGGTITGNIDGIGSPAVDDCLRFTINTSNSNHGVTLQPTGAFNIGDRYRVRMDVFCPNGQQIDVIEVQGLSGAGVGLFITSATAGAWRTLTFEYTHVGAVSASLFIYGKNGSNYVYTGDGAAVFYLKNITVQEIGCIAEVEMTGGSGQRLRELSGNYFDVSFGGGTAATSANFRHLVPRRESEITFRLTATGNTQILGGIPSNARIRSVVANSNGSCNLSIGTASGGTQIVNAQALVSGRQDVALAGRFSANGQIWAAISASATVFVTVKYEITD
jgi:hypothetical protein